MIGMALVTILMAVGMAACGSDDDDKDLGGSGSTGSSTLDSEIVGTWVHDEIGKDYILYQQFTFDEDGTGNGYEVENREGQGVVYENKFLFTWTTSDGMLKIVAISGEYEGSVYNYTYKINGDVAYIEGQTWRRK